MPLSEITIRNTKPTDKTLKLADGGSLRDVLCLTGHSSFKPRSDISTATAKLEGRLSISFEYSLALQLAIATTRRIAVIREIVLSTHCRHSPLEKIGRPKRFKHLPAFHAVTQL